MRKLILFGLLALLVGSGRAAAVGALPGTWTYSEAQSFSAYPVYEVGGSFEGLPQTAIDHIAYYGGTSMTFPNFPGPVTLPTDTEPATDFTDFIYGDCTPPPVTDPYDFAGTCPFPLDVQTWPACMRNASLYAHPLTSQLLVVRGVPALSFNEGTRLELYSGNVTIVIFGGDAAQVLRAADALHVANPLALASSREYAWMGPFVSFNVLPPPTPGALSGTPPCHPVQGVDQPPYG